MDARKFRLAGAIAIAIVLPLLIAATSSGFPSRPTFQFLTVRAAAGELARLRSTSAGAASVAYQAFADSANTRTGYVGDAGGADSDISLTCDATNCNVRLVTNGAGLVLANGSTVTTNAALSARGLDRIARATINGIAGCTLNALFANTGVTSCSRSAAGTYTVNLTAAGFTGLVPVCTATVRSSSGGFYTSAEGTSTTGAAVLTYTGNTVTPADTGFSIVCVGT